MIASEYAYGTIHLEGLNLIFSPGPYEGFEEGAVINDISDREETRDLDMILTDVGAVESVQNTTVTQEPMENGENKTRQVGTSAFFLATIPMIALVAAFVAQWKKTHQGDYQTTPNTAIISLKKM
jgi:hypothetical protein